jgi:hypothetical protein
MCEIRDKNHIPIGSLSQTIPDLNKKTAFPQRKN